VFPWRGVLRAQVTIGQTVLPAGERVRVDSKHEGTFTITALPLVRDLTGTAPASSVDEPLCAAIERYLLGRQTLRWGQDQGSWRGLGQANQELQLSGDEDSPAVTVAPGERVALSPGTSAQTYGVSKANQYGVIPVGQVTMVLDLPPHTGPLQLLCYEMPPYAAGLAGLSPGFMGAANQLTCFGSGDADSSLAYWARSLGAPLSGPQIGPGQFATAGFQRGDLVQFYSDQHGYMHTAVATGDGTDVYSLWNVPVDYPVRVSLSALWSCAPSSADPLYVRTATPAWHRT
jgi:hypothetical protein